MGTANLILRPAARHAGRCSIYSLQSHVRTQLQYFPAHRSGISALSHTFSRLIGEHRTRRTAAVALSEQTTPPQQSHSCHGVAVCRSVAPRWLPLPL